MSGTVSHVVVKRFAFLLLAGILLLGAVAVPSRAQVHKKKKADAAIAPDNNVQPDKVLYDRAAADIKHGRHEVGRLNLQTLINTYPDSEYLAKAKLLIADSYYKQGGTANMTQAISGYKDFIVFFPFLPEASYSQLQVANCHYQQMEKADRDRTEAKEAESEFQTFLEKYPKDPLADKAMQHLREVQEVIAEGDYRVALYYYTKGDRRAAAARLIGVTRRYPLYSHSDHALWMLADIFDKSEKKEVAATYYAQIVKNYPLSSYVPNAKSRLVALKVPVPQADPKARALMVAEQNTPRPRESLVKRPLGLLKSGPTNEMHAAARVGAPNLEPEADSASATDILSGGNRSAILVGGSSGGGGGANTTGNSTGIVATVTPGGPKNDTNGTTDVTGPTEGGAPPQSAAPASTDGSAAPTATPSSPGAAAAAPATPGESSSATADGTAVPATDANGAPAAGTDAAKPADTTSDSTTADDKSKESSSKKKKGMRKLVPW